MKSYLKSKTLNFNILVPAIAMIAKGVGYEIPPDVVTGILALGNFILRFITKVPLSEK